MHRLFGSAFVILSFYFTGNINAVCQSTNTLRSQGLDAYDQARSDISRTRRLQSLEVGACPRSWLGYQCTQLVCGRIRIHWSVGGNPPTGDGCFYLQNASQLPTTAPESSPDPATPLVHIAIQTDLTEYVALSWPRMPGVMTPADAVIGLRNPHSNMYEVAAYKISGYRADQVQPDGAVTIINARVDANSTSLTACFTRDITQMGQAASVRISLEAMDMNFVASANPFGMSHSLSKDYKCSVRVTLARTAGGQDDGGWRPSNVSGGTGHEGHILLERMLYIRIHGALQFTGWIVLVPLGILAARHRWLFAPSAIVGLWFQLHRTVQMIAAVLVVTGFILPWTSFESKDEEELLGSDHDKRMNSDLLLQSHASLAIALMVALGLHIAMAALRPKPDAPRRWMWNLVHWWTGRSLALLAGVNVAIGITLWRRVSGSSGIEWIVPFVLFAAAWVVLAAWLERRAPEGLGREGGYVLNAQGGILLPGYVASTSPMSSPLSSPSGSERMARLSGTASTDGLIRNKL